MLEKNQWVLYDDEVARIDRYLEHSNQYIILIPCEYNWPYKDTIYKHMGSTHKQVQPCEAKPIQAPVFQQGQRVFYTGPDTKYIKTGVVGIINYIDKGSLYPYGLQTEENQGDFVSPFNLQPINY